MDRVAQKSVAATLLALAAIFALLYAGNTVDILSEVTKPVVIGILRAAGVDAVDEVHMLRAGRLEVPWTGDCAGLNILAILVAVTLWANRHGPFGAGFWLRIALTLPLAYAANLARILSLIALRWVLYPAVESPQLHYFIGFVWVLPVLALLLRAPTGATAGFFRVEILRIAAVLSLVAPFVSAPGGLWVSACSLVLLARHRWNPPHGMPGVALFCGWILAGASIASARMESLWIPWLLACPAYLEWRPARMATLLLLLPGTVPVFAMRDFAPWILVPALVWELIQLFQTQTDDVRPSAAPGSTPLLLTVAAFHVFPFFAAGLAMFGEEPFPPPAGAMIARQKGGFSTVRTVRQPPDLNCYWYEPGEGGRHHTLGVCLQYRGVRAGASPGGALSDGRLWMTEFFLLPDGELCDYSRYLARTFFPFSKNGAHIVYSAPRIAMTERQFLEMAGENAKELRELLLAE